MAVSSVLSPQKRVYETKEPEDEQMLISSAVSTIQQTPSSSSSCVALWDGVTSRVTLQSAENYMKLYQGVPCKNKPPLSGDSLAQAQQADMWARGEAYPEVASCQNLSLSGMSLTALPPTIVCFLGLQNLELSNNELTGLPEEIATLPELQFVDLDKNNLSLFPKQVFAPKMKLVSVKDNPIVRWPEELLRQIKEKEIIVWSTPMRHTREERGGLVAIFKRLGLLEDSLETSVDENMQIIAKNILGSWKTQILATEKLSLWWYFRVSGMPREICLFEHLTHLDYSRNSLPEIPREIGQLQKLSHLNLAENSLQTLPREIGDLTSLVELDLSSNDLKSLPPEIQKLINLKKLSIYHNPVKRFARSFDMDFLQPEKFPQLVMLVIDSPQHESASGRLTRYARSKVPQGASSVPIWIRNIDALETLPKEESPFQIIVLTGPSRHEPVKDTDDYWPDLDD